jgi:hypothetical protein
MKHARYLLLPFFVGALVFGVDVSFDADEAGFGLSYGSEAAAQQRTTKTTTRTTTRSRHGVPSRSVTTEHRVTYTTGPVVQTRTYVRYHRGPGHVRHRYYWHHGHHVHHHHYRPPQREVIIVEVEPKKLPPISCPVRTESYQNEHEQWCATARGTMHGPFLRWHENGHIAVEGNYAYGVKDGIWTEWHPNGEPRAEGEYVDGERVGVWVRWNQYGEESSVIDYGR